MRARTPLSSFFFKKVTGCAEAPTPEESTENENPADPDAEDTTDTEVQK